MHINDNGLIIEGGTLIDGILYHESFPTSGASGFHEVVTSAPPTVASTVLITGYRVDLIEGVYTQVWETRNKTEEEYTPELASAKQEKQLSLKMTYWYYVTEDISFTTASNSTKIYQANQESIFNIKSMLATYTTETPIGFYWVTKDDYRETPFTRQDLQNLATVIGDRGHNYFEYWQDKKLLVNEKETIEEVNAVVW